MIRSVLHAYTVCADIHQKHEVITILYAYDHNNTIIMNMHARIGSQQQGHLDPRGPLTYQ